MVLPDTSGGTRRIRIQDCICLACGLDQYEHWGLRSGSLALTLHGFSWLSSAALFLTVSARSNQCSSGNSIDHSSDAHDCSGGRDQIGHNAQNADQNCHTQEADAPKKCYPTEPVRSPHRYSAHMGRR